MNRPTAVPTILLVLFLAAGFMSCAGSTRSMPDDARDSGDGQSGTSPERPGWKLFWSDEFAGSIPDSAAWDFDLGDGKVVGNPGWGNNELEYYTASEKNVFIRDGKLVIKAVKETTDDPAYGKGSYTSARLVTRGKKSFTYGRVEARMKLPAGKGLWPAFWMMPEPVPGTGAGTYGGWAASGEVDIMEARGSVPGRIGGTIHYGGTWPNNVYTGKDYVFSASDITDFHMYAVEWEPGEFRWYVDDELYAAQNAWYSRKPDGEYREYPAPFNRPFHVILNLAVGGNYDGNPAGDAKYFPAEMQVEYVRVYRREDYPRKVDPPLVAGEPMPDGIRKPDAEGNYILNGVFASDPNGDGRVSGFSGDPDLNRFDHDADASTAGVNAFFADNWAHLNNAGGRSAVSVTGTGKDAAASVAISAGGSELHSVQLIQYVPLVKGHRYVLTFDASASGNRSIGVKIGGDADRGWAAYASPSFNLSGTRSACSSAFLMNGETDTAARLEFNLGKADGTVIIGNVRLVMEDLKAPSADGNLAYNHEFRIDGTGVIPSVPGTPGSAWWAFDPGSGTTGAVEEDLDSEGKLRNFFVMVTAAGRDTSGKERASLSQPVPLAEGYDYRVSFDALGTGNGTMDVRLSGTPRGVAVAYAEEKDIPLFPIAKRFEFTFAMKEKTDGNAVLEFLPAGGGKTAVTNIRLTELGPHEDSSGVRPPDGTGNLLRDIAYSNGIADNDGTNPWAFYLHAEARADAEVSVAGEGGTAAASFEFGSIGNAVWNSQLFQTEVQLESGKNYVFSFRARASSPREIVAKIIHSVNYSYYSAVNEAASTVSLESEWKTFSFPFTKRGSDMHAKVEFDLGPVSKTRPDWKGTVQIADVRLEYAR